MWVIRPQSRFLPQPLPERVPSVSRTATPLHRGCEARDIAGTTHGLDPSSLQPQATWLTGRDLKGTLHIRDHGCQPSNTESPTATVTVCAPSTGTSHPTSPMWVECQWPKTQEQRPQHVSVRFLCADVCNQSQFLFIVDPCCQVSLFLADRTFVVFPVHGHNKAAMNIFIHAFGTHILVFPADS